MNKLLPIETLLPRMIRTKSSTGLRPRVGTATTTSETAFKNEKLKQTLKDSQRREEESRSCCVPVVKSGTSTLAHVMPSIDHVNTAVLADTL